MDETHVDAEFGIRVKGFCLATGNAGPPSAFSSREGKHLTAVITFSAKGEKLLAVGKRIMKNWFTPVHAIDTKLLNGNLHRLSDKN